MKLRPNVLRFEAEDNIQQTWMFPRPSVFSIRTSNTSDNHYWLAVDIVAPGVAVTEHFKACYNSEALRNLKHSQLVELAGWLADTGVTI